MKLTYCRGINRNKRTLNDAKFTSSIAASLADGAGSLCKIPSEDSPVRGLPQCFLDTLF